MTKLEGIKYSPQWFFSNVKKYFPDMEAKALVSTVYVHIKREMHIDLSSLDVELERAHGKIPDGVSICDFLVEKYGQEATDWVQSAI